MVCFSVDMDVYLAPWKLGSAIHAVLLPLSSLSPLRTVLTPVHFSVSQSNPRSPATAAASFLSAHVKRSQFRAQGMMYRDRGRMA